MGSVAPSPTDPEFFTLTLVFCSRKPPGCDIELNLTDSEVPRPVVLRHPMTALLAQQQISHSFRLPRQAFSCFSDPITGSCNA